MIFDWDDDWDEHAPRNHASFVELDDGELADDEGSDVDWDDDFTNYTQDDDEGSDVDDDDDDEGDVDVDDDDEAEEGKQAAPKSSSSEVEALLSCVN